MIKRNLTKEELESKCKDLVPSNKITEHSVTFISLEEHQSDEHIEKWVTQNRPYELLPAFVIDERYYCCFDVSRGADVVFDLKNRACEWRSQGVFHEDYIFISDYYGFPKGEFFIKATLV